MKIDGLAVVVDDCDLSPEELEKSLRECLTYPEATWWDEFVTVREYYYPKRRIIKTRDRRFIIDLIQAVEMLIKREEDRQKE
jgi:hypothetical protein